MKCATLWAPICAAAVLYAGPCSAKGIADCPAGPMSDVDHAAFKGLPKEFFSGTPVWSSLTVDEGKLLVDVSLEQLKRNIILGREYFDTKPKNIKEVKIGSRAVELTDEAGVALSKMFGDLKMASEAEKVEDPIVVSNGYRSFATQKEMWGPNLLKYFFEKKNDLALMRNGNGGYSTAAICSLRQYAANRYALPGFSTHHSGQALDFNFGVLTAKTDRQVVKAWCQSWLFQWLRRNAAAYGFRQNPQIDEPWHWVFDPQTSSKAPDQLRFAATCLLVK
jgi:hypothetical protein